MKSHLSLAASVVLSMVVLHTGSPSPAAAQNLLVNGTFDADAAGWATPNEFVTFFHRSDTGNDLVGGSGPGCMEVQFRMWNGTSSGAQQEIDVVEGTTYEFSGVYFSPSGDNVIQGVRVYARWLDETGQAVSFDQITDFPPLVEDRWTPLSGTVTVPEGIHAAHIQVAVQNPTAAAETRPGIAYFDDLWFAPVGLSSAVQQLFVPAAASTPGNGGTFWTTSAWVSNLSSSAVVVRAAALLQGQGNAGAVESPIEIGIVEGGGFLRIDDVYHRIGADSAAGGLFLELTAEGELPYTRLVSVATYTSTPNPTGGGAYGQGIPATGPGADAEAHCPGIKDHGGHRTNIGVLNTSDSAIEVEIEIVDAAGDKVGSGSWLLAPFEQRQQRVTTLGAAGLDGGTATIRLRSSAGSFLAYSSVVDNQTGDAVFIAGN
jgi:hypothetical protein